MNLDTVKNRLNKLIAQLGSQRAAADHLGVSQAHLHDILHDRRKPGPKVLDALGLEQIPVGYRERTREALAP